MSHALTKIDTTSAPLPVVYTNAIAALANCERVDECADWKNKAEAIASYARQSKDETLLHTAMRIKGRAVRRVGELLREIPEQPGKRTDLEPKAGAGPRLETRANVAERVDMSPRQVKDALRVAAIPEKKFERAIEADKPATITELAKLGTKPKAPSGEYLRGRDPRDFNASLHGLAAVRNFARDAQSKDIAAIVRGTDDDGREKALVHIKAAMAWLTRLQAALEKKK